MATKSKTRVVLHPDDDFSDLIGVTLETPNKGEYAPRKRGRPPNVVTSDSNAVHLELKKAELKKTAFNANMAELDFKIKAGEYLPREEVRQACAKAFAAVSQSMRSIPDNLERRAGVAASVTQAVGDMIDEVMNALSTELEQIHSENAG